MNVRAALTLVLCLVSTESLHAVVQRTIALKSVLSGESWIAVARIDRLDEARAEMTVTRNLKGSGNRTRIAIELTGDAEAKRVGQPKQLVARLAPGVEVVLFGSSRAGRLTLIGYANGTWFQMIGEAGPGSEKNALSFTHFEPYLRRTYKDATADLVQIIVGCIDGRREPPAPDPNEPPGIGPPVKQ